MNSYDRAWKKETFGIRDSDCGAIQRQQPELMALRHCEGRQFGQLPADGIKVRIGHSIAFSRPIVASAVAILGFPAGYFEFKFLADGVMFCVSDKLEGASAATATSDYYGALVAVTILAILGGIVSLTLLLILFKRCNQNKAAISACRKSQSAYDNPSYKVEIQQETMGTPINDRILITERGG